MTVGLKKAVLRTGGCPWLPWRYSCWRGSGFWQRWIDKALGWGPDTWELRCLKCWAPHRCLIGAVLGDVVVLVPGVRWARAAAGMVRRCRASDTDPRDHGTLRVCAKPRRDRAAVHGPGCGVRRAFSGGRAAGPVIAVLRPRYTRGVRGKRPLRRGSESEYREYRRNVPLLIPTAYPYMHTSKAAS